MCHEKFYNTGNYNAYRVFKEGLNNIKQVFNE